MQTRTFSSVIFRSRAVALAAATTVAFSGLSVASASDVQRAPTGNAPSDAPTRLTLKPSGVGLNHVAQGPGATAGSGGHAGSDATQTYTGAAGTGLFSSPTNWSAGPLAAGDTLVFGTTPAGNYAVTNDLASTVFGPLAVQRSLGSETVTLNGGFKGTLIQAAQGKLIINGGSVNVTSDLTTGAANEYSLGAGLGSGGTADGTLVIQGGATVAYNDLLTGVGGTGRVDILGAGTTLTGPTPSATATSVFRGGGSGTSIVNILDGATVNTNRYFSNNLETATIANGGTLNANDWIASDGSDAGGQIDIGRFLYPPTSGTVPPVPNAVMNVNAGGTINSTFLDIAGINAGQNGTVNVNGGTANHLSVSLGDPLTGDGNVDDPLTYATGKLNVTNGGTVNTGDMIAATGNASRGEITVSGTDSAIIGSGVLLTSGSSGDAGAGSSKVTVNAGGTMVFSQVQFGGNTATFAASDFSGTTMVVDGTDSVFAVTGVPETAPGAGDAFSALLFVSNAGGQKSNITVSNGGDLDLLSTSTDPNQNGALIVGQAANTTSNITVDGEGSLLSAGTFLQIEQRSSSGAALTNAKTTINITNGGTFQVIDDGAQFSGNAQIGLNFNTAAPSSGASIEINVGGGSGSADADSFFLAQGGMFLGNTGTTTAPIAGVPITVNVNNGAIAAGQIDVGPNTVINLNKGMVQAGLISVAGGSIRASSTAAAGSTVLLADAYEVGGNGYIDLGKGGGISVIFEGDTDDLSTIKSLIVAGLNGGNNSIRSSFVAANPGKYGIGYALRNPNGIASFLGVALDPTESDVLFRVTLKGDTDLSGNVSFTDLVALAGNYNGNGKEWYQGDFDYDTDVDFNDLVSLAANYNGTFTVADAAALGGQGFAQDWALAQSLVPEPTTLALGAAAFGLVGRRRRR